MILILSQEYYQSKDTINCNASTPLNLQVLNEIKNVEIHEDT